LRLAERCDARCVGPTSAISLLRISTRASSASVTSDACAPAWPERLPAARQSNSLRRAARTPRVHRGGRCLPVAMRADRTSDTPVASPPGSMTLARARNSREPPRPPSASSRERDRPRNDPRCLPSGEDPCPATPFRASGSGLFQRRGLATAMLSSDAFEPPQDPCESSGSWVPVHAPRCHRVTRFSGPRRRSPTSATVTTHGHTQRAADPRTRVGLSPRYSPAPTDAGCVGPPYVAALRTCEPRAARAGLHRRVPLAWMEQLTGRSSRAKTNARS